MFVSKRFALLTPLISSVTLSNPRSKEESLFEFFQAQVIYAFKAHRSFRRIRPLYLELIEEEERDLRWKAMFGSNTCTCACLVFDSISKLSSASASVSATASQTIKAPVNEAIYRRIGYPNLWRNFFSGFSTNG